MLRWGGDMMFVGSLIIVSAEAQDLSAGQASEEAQASAPLVWRVDDAVFMVGGVKKAWPTTSETIFSYSPHAARAYSSSRVMLRGGAVTLGVGSAIVLWGFAGVALGGAVFGLDPSAGEDLAVQGLRQMAVGGVLCGTGALGVAFGAHPKQRAINEP